MRQVQTVRCVRTVWLPPEFDLKRLAHREALERYFDGQDWDDQQVTDESQMNVNELPQLPPPNSQPGPSMEELGLKSYGPDSLVDRLLQLLAKRMGQPVEQFDPDRPLAHQGLDSLDAAEYALDVEDWLGCAIIGHEPPYQTVRQLARYIRDRLPNQWPES